MKTKIGGMRMISMVMMTWFVIMGCGGCPLSWVGSETEVALSQSGVYTLIYTTYQVPIPKLFRLSVDFLGVEVHRGSITVAKDSQRSVDGGHISDSVL